MPEEISSRMFLKMKERTKERIRHNINDVVITVLAYFNDSQRLDVGKIASLNFLGIINESTASVFSYYYL